jgi:murein L,D-transpeptidase YafK
MANTSVKILSWLFRALIFSQLACCNEVAEQNPDWVAGGPLNLDRRLVSDSKVKLSKILKPERKIALLIDKSDYLLAVLQDNQVIKIYPVVFGFGAGPDKLREGDGATPEGVFSIKQKYPHPDWNYFLWLNYPTRDSWRKHESAKSQGKIPAKAGIGSEVGIHGVPLEQNRWIDQRKNWTAGCISLKNNDIKEIYPWIQVGTRVKIIP